MNEAFQSQGSSRRELHDAAMAHPAREAESRWRSWGIVASAMNMNRRELLELIDLPSDDESLALELVQNVKFSMAQQQYNVEIYRLLQNYVASAMTVVAHSRNLMSRYVGSPVSSEYHQRVKDLKDSSVTDFVQDLRNVLLHGGLIQLEKTLSYPGSHATASPVWTVELNRESMLKSKRLSAGGKAYLRSQKASFDLRTPIEEYGALASSLCKWMNDQFEVLHGAEWRAYRELLRPLNPQWETNSPEQ